MITYSNYDIDTQKVTIPVYKGEVEIVMDELFMYYGCHCDIEVPVHSDDLYALRFLIGDTHYTGRQLVEWFNENFNTIHDETEENESDERNMREELSSPYLTGRV